MQRNNPSWLNVFIPLSILLNLLFISANSNAYDFCEVKEVEHCVEPAETRLIDGFPHHETCWKYEAVFDCYDMPVTSCSPEDDALEKEAVVSVDSYTASHRPIIWTEKKVTSNNCTEQVNTEFGCSSWESGGIDDPLGDTITCHTGPKLSCAPEACQVLTQTCTHYTNGVCDQEVIKYSCSQMNVCGSDLGPAIDENDKSNFGAAVAEAAIIDVIASNGQVDPITGEITLFEGRAENCVAISQDWAKAAAVSGTVATVLAYAFGGPLGMLSAPVSAYVAAVINDDLDCCHDNPDKVDPLKSFGLCSDDHKDLSIAKLTNRAVPLGEKMTHTCFCTDGVTGTAVYFPISEIGVEGDCSQLCNNPYLQATTLFNPFAVKKPQSWKEYYCVFDDILSKIIQTQGREQIREILSGPSATDRVEVNKTTSFYGNGEWGSPTLSNGNIISFWEWDVSCNNDENHNSEGFSENSGLFADTVCPVGNEVYVAACSKENSADCGYYPDTPLEFNESWDVRKIDLIGNPLWEEVNQYSAVVGECYEDKSCDWKIRTWPSAVGSKIMQKTNLVWQLKFPYPSEVAGQTQSWDIFKGGAGTLEFEMLTTIDQNEPEAEPTIRVSSTGSNVWEEFQIPNPTPGPEFSITTAAGIQIFLSGNCNSMYCNYNVSRKIQLTLKPWYQDQDGGSERYCLFDTGFGCVEHAREHRRDTRDGFCDGFTLDEFSILDIKNMDLSEYTDTLTDRAASSILKLIEESP